MNGLSNALGAAERTVKIAGRAWPLRKLSISHTALIESRLAELRGNPLVNVERMLQGVTDPEFRRVVMREAAAAATRGTRATREEIAEYVGSADGVTWLLWKVLGEGRPEFVAAYPEPSSLLAVLAAETPESQQEIAATLAWAVGLGDLGGSSGAAATAPVVPA